MSRDNLRIWEGIYGSFAEVVGDPDVFEGNIWLQKVAQRAERTIAMSRSDDYVAPVAETRDYVLPTVAAILAKRDKPLRILDFGGGMATSYLPLKAMLHSKRTLEFVIVENEEICRRGRELFAQEPELVFTTDLRSADGQFDIVHFGSSLHYVEKWKELLLEVRALQPTYLICADVPAAENASFVTGQNYYGRRIPVWFWNAAEFVEQVCSLGFELLMKSRYRGYWLGQNSGPPTDNFEASHRLSYLSQFVFRRTDP